MAFPSGLLYPGSDLWPGDDAFPVSGLIVATAENDGKPPRIRLEVNVPDGAVGVSVLVFRDDPDGWSREVRGASPAAITDTWVGYDYEAALGAPITYRCVLTSDIGPVNGLSEEVTLDVDQAWLVHIGSPTLSIPLPVVQAEGPRVRPVSRGVFSPYGRREPLVVTDGRRRAPESTLLLYTETLAEEDGLLQILDDASVLLLNIPVPMGVGITREYISIGDVESTRLATMGAFQPRSHSLPYQVVAAPTGASQTGRTYATLLTEHSTYTDILGTYVSYAELLAPTVL